MSQKVINNASRVVQGLAILALIALIAIDAYSQDFEVPTLVYGGVVGVAIGIDPEDLVGRIFRGK